MLFEALPLPREYAGPVKAWLQAKKVSAMDNTYGEWSAVVLALEAVIFKDGGRPSSELLHLASLVRTANRDFHVSLPMMESSIALKTAVAFIGAAAGRRQEEEKEGKVMEE